MQKSMSGRGNKFSRQIVFECFQTRHEPENQTHVNSQTISKRDSVDF